MQVNQNQLINKNTYTFIILIRYAVGKEQKKGQKTINIM